MSYFKYTEATKELGRYVGRRMKYHSDTQGQTVGVYCFCFVAVAIATIGVQLLTGTILVLIPATFAMALLCLTYFKCGDYVKGMNKYNWRWWRTFTKYSYNLYDNGGILDGSIDLDVLDSFLADKAAGSWDAFHASASRPRLTQMYIPGVSQTFRSIMKDIDDLEDGTFQEDVVLYFRDKEDLIEFKMRVL